MPDQTVNTDAITHADAITHVATAISTVAPIAATSAPDHPSISIFHRLADMLSSLLPLAGILVARNNTKQADVIQATAGVLSSAVHS